MNARLSSFVSSVRRGAALTALGLGVALGTTACGSTGDMTETAASPETAAPAASPAGFPSFVDFALALQLRPDQRATITALQAKVHTDSAPVRDARAKLGAEVAAEVRAGKLDHARIQPLADQVADAAGRMKPTLQLVAQQVHDTLDTTQRKALVAAMREHGERARGDMKARMNEQAAELGLTAPQRSTIKEHIVQAFASHAAEGRAARVDAKARMEALAAAFEEETFDAKALDIGSHAASGAHRIMGIRGVFLEAALPVLTAAQREQVAARIEARAEALEE